MIRGKRHHRRNAKGNSPVRVNLGGADCVGSTLARPKMTWLFPHATMYLSPERADNPNYEFGDFYILSNSNSNKRVTTWSFF